MAKIYTPATKSLNPWNVDDNRGWNIIGGNADADERELVPTVADCIDEIGKGLADLPFTVYDAKGNVVDDSDDYKNITGAIPDPYSFMWLSAASLVMSGQAYWHKRKNPAGFTKGLSYWAFANVTPQITPTTNPETLTFRRSGNTQPYPAKDVLYIWMPDPKVEFGPAVSYPLKRALRSAGALSAISTFIDNYMNSGMVKAFIAQSEVPPSSEDEKREIEDYLTKMLTGVKRALTKIRVIKKTMTISSIGGGLDELKNVGIVKEIKQDVLEAFGVPASRVWGNAANYATAANDTLVFVTSEIMPLARVIQNSLNEQVFKPYGFTLIFEPRRMEEFSIVLGEKIKSLEGIAKSLERAMGPAEALKASIDILGLELSPELIDKIELSITDANKKPEPPVIEPAVLPAPLEVSPPEPDVSPAQVKALVELDKWHAKSEKAGKTVTWHAIDIPEWAVKAIEDGQTWQDVRDAIKAPPVGHPFYGNQWVSFSSGTFGGGDDSSGGGSVGPTKQEKAEAEAEYFASNEAVPDWAGGAKEDRRRISAIAQRKADARNRAEQVTLEERLAKRESDAAYQNDLENRASTFTETPLRQEQIDRVAELHKDLEDYRTAAIRVSPGKKEQINAIADRMRASLDNNMHPDVLWMMANFEKIGISQNGLIVNKPREKRKKSIDSDELINFGEISKSSDPNILALAEAINRAAEAMKAAPVPVNPHR